MNADAERLAKAFSNSHQEYWYFTFGPDHQHPKTGESLANHYVKVPGNYNTSRDLVIRDFGRNWAFQYRELSDFDGSKRTPPKQYRLKELIWEWV